MASIEPDDAWRAHLLKTSSEIRTLLEKTHRVAVLGIKPESHADRPAFYVPEYVQQAGLQVIPVPVYYPHVTTILGKPVFRSLREVPGSIDLVDVFRRPEHIEQHVDDILAARPRAVWFQSGIRHDVVAERLAREGIDVVQDRCLMVELSRIGR